ncbi:MAG: translocation/assembly module TamB domain-containing protein [Thermaceae bacterium]
MKRWVPLGVFFLGLWGGLGLPLVLTYALERALSLSGFSGTVQSVRGHLLLGLRLEGVDLSSKDLKIKAERLWVSYDLLGLLRGELPVGLRVEKGRLEPTWEGLFPEGAPPPSRLRIVFRSLALDEVEVRLEEGKRLRLPPLHLTLSGGNPYRFLARIGEGRLWGEARALDPLLSSWEIRYQGELRALSYYYPGLSGGRAEGVWRIGPEGLTGENKLQGGRLLLLGFGLSQVEGVVGFKEDRFTARLRGVGLEGPVEAEGEVDLRKAEYRFKMTAKPSLPALARHYHLNLPLEGQGRVELWGRGWEAPSLRGVYEGQGRFLGEPLALSGSLGFDGVFWLRGKAESRYLDRSHQVKLSLRGNRYGAILADNLGSWFNLRGEGVRTEGKGEVVWPKPLSGRARVSFRSEGASWRARVESPGVGLPLTPGLDLSGNLQGEGSQVEGRLGPLALAGRWDDLALSLSPTPLLVGEVQGQGRFQGGRLAAWLRYASSYTTFPIRVWQEGRRFFLQAPGAFGEYEGAFRLKLDGFAVRLGEEVRLYGGLIWRDGPSGRLEARGERVQAQLELLDRAFRGRLKTPLGSFPLAGAWGKEGVWIQSQGLSLLHREGVRLQGRLNLGARGFLEADLAYREGFSGWARLAISSGGVEERITLLGRGTRLLAEAQGVLEGKGEVWPRLQLEGRLIPPMEGLDLPPLAFRLDQRGLRLPGVGEVRLDGRFTVRLSGRYRGVGLGLEAVGDPEGGRVLLRTPYGVLHSEGPWRRMALSGKATLPYLGEGEVEGWLDLLGLRHQASLRFAALRFALKGEGTRARFSFQGLGGRIFGAGFYDGVFRYTAFFNEADLEALGLPVVLSGRFGDKGGRLKVNTPYGEAYLEGEAPLAARFFLNTPYAQGRGNLDLRGVEARLDLKPPFLGQLTLKGPWPALVLEGKGRLSSPMGPFPFALLATLEGGRFRYRVEGPLRLQGEGYSFQGRLDWPFVLWGKEGWLKAELGGEGGRLVAQGKGEWAGIPVGFEAFAEGLALTHLRGRLWVEEGEVRLQGDRLGLDLSLAPLAKALGLEAKGRLRGTLDLKGMGSLEGEGEAYGEVFRLAYRDRSLEVFLPEHGLGMGLNEGEVWGLGALSGRVGLRPLGGMLSYEKISLVVGGSLDRPRGSLFFPDGELSFVADLSQAEAQGQLVYASSWAQGRMELFFRRGRYEGKGWLKGLAYLLQEGPLYLEGEGARANLRWEAPLAVGLMYGKEPHLTLKGRGEVRYGDFPIEVHADLSYAPSSGYRGGVVAEGMGFLLTGKEDGLGGLGLRLRGRGLEGEGRLEGLGFRMGLRYEENLARLLGREQAYPYLRVQARLWGSLPHLFLEGEGVLLGEGRREGFTFSYDGLPHLSAPGLGVVLEGEELQVDLDQDLTPFGLPLRVKLQGKGPWREARLSAELVRPEGSLKGWVEPARQRASLEGEVLGERVGAAYERGLVVRFSGPRVFGEGRLERGGLRGALLVELPLGEGGLRGRLDLARLFLDLKGYGAYSGGLRAWGRLGEEPTLSLEADLAFKEVFLKGAFSYAWKEKEVKGQGRVETPYGGVGLLGRGEGVDLRGEGLPLEGRLELKPFSLKYRYEGDLPLGLGVLEAEGTHPGTWLKGVYRGFGQTLHLLGKEGFRLRVEGEGLRGILGPRGVEGHLSEFALFGLLLSGKVQGEWNGISLDLTAQGWGRKARLVGLWDGGLKAKLTGDLEGELTYREGWSGEVRFKEGWLALGGRGLPELKGEVLGLSAHLRYPRLDLGGLRLDLLDRRAEGQAGLWGVEAVGKGEEVELAYPPLRLKGRLSLKEASLKAWTELGEGELVYEKGQVLGVHALRHGPLSLTLEGAGDGLRLSGRVEPTPWWPEEVVLSGEAKLSLEYAVRFTTGEEKGELRGQGGQFSLSLEGPYGSGEMAWPEGRGAIRLALPLRPLESTLRLTLKGDLSLEGDLEGGVGRVKVAGQLWPLGLEGWLEKAKLREFLARFLPHLDGTVSGRLALGSKGLEVDLGGEALAPLPKGTVRLPFAFKGGGGGEAFSGEGRVGESAFQLRYGKGLLEGTMRAQVFPLHALFAAFVGPLEGEAYWTGALRFRLPRDPWQAQAVLVGEEVRFLGGGDELSGRVVLSFDRGRLGLDQLALSGKGTWRGGGYWSREGADLWLSLRETAFTPVLQVVPALRPYAPEGSGSVEFRLGKENGQEVLAVSLEEFRFKLGPAEGYLPRGVLRLNGGAQAEGEILLLKPFSGKGVLGLEGDLSAFTLSAQGRLRIPGLKEEEPFLVAFRYPTYGLEIRYAQALAQGTAYPLRMAAYGTLPVRFPRYYLLDGVVNIKSAFLYEEKGVYHLTGDLEVQSARLGLPEGEKEVALPAGEGGKGVPLVFENLRIRAERGVVIQEALAQGELYGEAYLQGTYQDPYLTGEVRALWGNLRLWDQVFVLDPGASDARFTPQGGVLPEIRLMAKSEVRGYTVHLEARGAFVREGGRVKLRLDPRFSSDPPLDTLEIYALLTLGSPDVTRLEGTVAPTLLGAAFQNLLLGQLERELSRALGLDRLQVEIPAFGGDLEGTRFTVGKYLTRELFLGYQVDLRGGQALAAEYRRDGFSLTFSTTLATRPKTLLGLGYSLTPSLDLFFSLESNEVARFSVGLSYRF